MAVYARFIKTAKRLIAKYGEDAQWIVPADTQVNPDEPWNGGESTPVVYNQKMAFFKAGNGQLATIAKMNNMDVPIGGVKVLMGAVNFQPSDAHTIKRKDGRVLTILDIQEVNPNGESILFIVTCVMP